MTETEEFLAGLMPRLEAAEIALHSGEPAQRIAMWSRADPVTLFGAATTAEGWDEIEPVFRWLGQTFSDLQSYRVEVLAAGASGDLAYLVALEHVTCSMNGAPPRPYVLRATTVFRREAGQWLVVHRHGDPLMPRPRVRPAGTWPARPETASAPG